MEIQLSSAKDVEEFGRLFLHKYAEPAPYWNIEIVQTCENKNWEVAKAFLIIQYWYSTSYCNGSPTRKSEEEYFWADLLKDFVQTIKQYECKHELNWTKLLYAQLKFTKNALATVKSVKKILKLLIDNNQITLNDTFSRGRIFFMAFDLGAKFVERKLRRWDKASKKVIECTESLEYYVATSKDFSKSARLELLEFLSSRGALTLQPSGEKNIPVIFELAERRNVMALRVFLSHPQIHQVVDSEGRNVLHYLCKSSYLYMPYLKNFNVDQLKYLISASYRSIESMGTRIKAAIEDTGNKLGKFPTVFFQAVQAAVSEGLFGDLSVRDYNFFKLFGDYGPFIAIELGVENEHLDKLRKENAKEARKQEREANTSIPIGNTSFPFDELPLEIAHLICLEIDHETRSSLFLASKSTFALKTKFSEVMFDAIVQKEFGVRANVNYTAKGIKRYKALTSRRVNWKKGAYDVRFIEWREGYPWRFLCMDENWLSFQTDRGFKLWDCHNDQLHDLNGLTLSATSSLTYLKSRPGEIPTVVSYLMDYASQTFEICVTHPTGTQTKFKAKKLTIATGLIESLENNCVFTGGPGNVWNIETGQITGRIKIPKHSMKIGQYNPLNKLIFTKMEDKNSPDFSNPDATLALFDRNYQKVMALKDFKWNSFYMNRFCFVDEYTVIISSTESYIWDIRKPDLPRQFAECSIEKTYCSRYGISASKTDQRQAVIWDLKTGLWEKSIRLPEDFSFRKFTLIGNSRYFCSEMLRVPKLCLLDFQRTL